jgi:hypothetical protein
MPDVTCPQCGGSVLIDEHAATDVPVFCPNPGGLPYIDIRVVPVVAAFCNDCEWTHEIPASFLRAA